jgi:hypothetical protein
VFLYEQVLRRPLGPMQLDGPPPARVGPAGRAAPPLAAPGAARPVRGTGEPRLLDRMRDKLRVLR